MPTRRSQVIALLGLCGLLIAIAVWVWQPGEPRWAGRALSSWLSELEDVPESRFENPTLAKHIAATEAVRSMGTNALPTLLRRLEQPAPRVWEQGLAYLEEALRSRSIRCPWPDTEQRHSRRVDATLRGFFALREAATPAVPELSRRLHAHARDRRAAFFAAQALAAAGVFGVQELLTAATDTTALVRSYALVGLANAVTNRETAFKAVLGGLHDSDPAVRQRASWVVGTFREHPVEVVAALTNLLSDPDSRVRLKALYGLEWFRGDISSAATAVRALASDPSEQIRFRAAEVEKKLTAPTPPP